MASVFRSSRAEPWCFGANNAVACCLMMSAQMMSGCSASRYVRLIACSASGHQLCLSAAALSMPVIVSTLLNVGSLWLLRILGQTVYSYCATQLFYAQIKYEKLS